MSNDNPPMVERYSPPTETESLPQYSVCFVSDTSVWVQVAKDEDTARWIEFHSFDEALHFINEKKSVNTTMGKS